MINSPSHPAILLLTLLLTLLPPLGAAAADAHADAHSDTRRWLHHALSAELDEKPVAQWDWNLIASVVFPLARHHRRHDVEESAQLLRHTARRLAGVDDGALPCGKLADLHLTERFLEEAGIALPVKGGETAERQPRRQRLAACLSDAPDFDRANTLLLACRYGVPMEPERVARAAAELVAGQLEDGAFTDREGRHGYYLTSHAMLALHECGGHDEAVARAADKLTRHLEPFLRRGFLDGAAESLLFLRWVGRPAPYEARYAAAVRRWTTTDGGLCFNLHPGCEPHWHATALLLELLDLDHETAR